MKYLPTSYFNRSGLHNSGPEYDNLENNKNHFYQDNWSMRNLIEGVVDKEEEGTVKHHHLVGFEGSPKT